MNRVASYLFAGVVVGFMAGFYYGIVRPVLWITRG